MEELAEGFVNYKLKTKFFSYYNGDGWQPVAHFRDIPKNAQRRNFWKHHYEEQFPPWYGHQYNLKLLCRCYVDVMEIYNCLYRGDVEVYNPCTIIWAYHDDGTAEQLCASHSFWKSGNQFSDYFSN